MVYIYICCFLLPMWFAFAVVALGLCVCFALRFVVWIGWCLVFCLGTCWLFGFGLTLFGYLLCRGFAVVFRGFCGLNCWLWVVVLAYRLWVVVVLCFVCSFAVCLCYVCVSTLLPVNSVVAVGFVWVL